jgi:hypothetical protein
VKSVDYLVKLGLQDSLVGGLEIITEFSKFIHTDTLKKESFYVTY